MFIDTNTVGELNKSKIHLEFMLQELFGKVDSSKKRTLIEDELHFIEIIIHLSKNKNN
jgi:hypothetical protein